MNWSELRMTTTVERKLTEQPSWKDFALRTWSITCSSSNNGVGLDPKEESLMDSI